MIEINANVTVTSRGRPPRWVPGFARGWFRWDRTIGRIAGGATLDVGALTRTDPVRIVAAKGFELVLRPAGLALLVQLRQTDPDGSGRYAVLHEYRLWRAKLDHVYSVPVDVSWAGFRLAGWFTAYEHPAEAPAS